MVFVRLSAAALVALSTAACSGNPATGTGPRENTGTLVGAVAGGLIGSQFGGGTGERIAAGLAGAALGGLIGNRIGAGMDDEDKQRAYAAQMQALESGRSGAAVGWKNPDSGRYGSVEPGNTTNPDGRAMAVRRIRRAVRLSRIGASSLPQGPAGGERGTGTDRRTDRSQSPFPQPEGRGSIGPGRMCRGAGRCGAAVRPVASTCEPQHMRGGHR